MLQQRSPSHPLATPISPIHLVQQHDGDKRLASSPVMLPSQLTFQQSSLFPPTNHIRPSKSSQIITPYSEQMTFYQSLLKELIANKNGHPFLHPVDPENMGIPEYSDVIVHPMNLLAIKKNLDSNKYEANIDQAAYDLFLVIDNCYRFNPPGLDVSLAAEFLHKLIVRQ
ncbi:putative Bromodomain [Blattamonas nauphoetae]|uniref:Bromodomain n=1 Tax=Blattamonas nauphoetae TaxID=2049346 RepID=A0ABQ9XJY8_9EUKA|nr:putative Bromodomain [Blattamonas nauphoetae]